MVTQTTIAPHKPNKPVDNSNKLLLNFTSLCHLQGQARGDLIVDLDPTFLSKSGFPQYLPQEI